MTDERFQHWLDVFERAGEFTDAGFAGQGWKPSELLKIGLCMIATGLHPERAEGWATLMMTKARKLYREGSVANPFEAAMPLSPLPTEAEWSWSGA